MQNEFIVLVRDEENAQHARISVLKDQERAERFLERLLRVGVKQELIRVFAGNSLNLVG